MTNFSFEQLVQMIKLYLRDDSRIAPFLRFTWSFFPVYYSVFGRQIRVYRFSEVNEKQDLPKTLPLSFCVKTWACIRTKFN